MCVYEYMCVYMCVCIYTQNPDLYAQAQANSRRKAHLPASKRENARKHARTHARSNSPTPLIRLLLEPDCQGASIRFIPQHTLTYADVC